MICHRQRLVFVHLRRTAGNSVELALGGIELFDADGRPTSVWDNRLHRGPSPHKRDHRGHPIHATAAEIRRAYPREFAAYFRFSIVRNPWEQMASLYGRLFPDDRAGDGFRGWLRGFRAVAGTVPQPSLCDARGGCLVDFVGRYESLAADFDRACDLAGLPRRTLPRTNSAAETRTRIAWDDRSIALVSRLYAADIERFGYEFPEARMAA